MVYSMQSRVSDVFVKSLHKNKIVQLEWLYSMQSRVSDVFVKSASTGTNTRTFVLPLQAFLDFSEEASKTYNDLFDVGIFLENSYGIGRVSWRIFMHSINKIGLLEKCYLFHDHKMISLGKKNTYLKEKNVSATASEIWGNFLAMYFDFCRP